MEKLQSNQIEFLKWVAIFTMVTDHTGRVFFDNSFVLTSIGRIAFPLFAFLLAHNYIFYTKNKSKYISRLFIFAIISQPIYQALFARHTLNILFTLSLGLLLIYAYEQIRARLTGRELYLSSGLLFFIFFIIGFFISYSFFGIFLIFFIYLTIKNEKYKYWSSAFIYLANINSPIKAFFGLLAIPVILYAYKVKIDIKRTPKWFFYLFYPGHLLILLFGKYLVT